jgi:UDP-2-acetamido-2,6-beta-L-arabino-hexul-4-ose reductase
MRVLVTGAKGFIGRNLVTVLSEQRVFSVLEFNRGDDISALPRLVASSDVVVHLAGENRPLDEASFVAVNSELTRELCDSVEAVVRREGRTVPLVLASSIQAERINPYGLSKLAAEQHVKQLSERCGNPAAIYRLPGVFGKWCRPNYNSVVATFCHNIARGLEVTANDVAQPLRLVYVDDVVESIVRLISDGFMGLMDARVNPEYPVTVGGLADALRDIATGRYSLITERVGEGFLRALYATYISHLPPEAFSYPVPKHQDPRGVFVEMLKTRDSGQFSFFTAHPGVTRGGHYHHSKSEKFLVIRGDAVFRFRNLLDDHRFEIRTSGKEPCVVDTIPGWVHDITNVGSEELVVMLWANEVFDRARPDTIAGSL